ncbi:hypothetical protein BDW74DRAFT_179282 [Aspergillus multicolor]|uniref:uncharacterized protein n=1 Tax=Aspergillus multicolor TaxID=41759 RepID=UPI003CCCD6CD
MAEKELMAINNHTVNRATIQALGVLCQVNNQFYRSATRLLYRRVHLDLGDLGQRPLTPISIDKFSLSPHRRVVRHVMITCLYARDQDGMIRLQELATVLARFPSLKSLSISLARSSPNLGYSSKEKLILDALHQSLQAYGASGGGSFEELRIFNPEIPLSDCGSAQDAFNLSRVMPSLRRFEYVDQTPMYTPAQMAVFYALQHAHRIEEINLKGLGCITEASLALLPDHAPLRRLELGSMTLRAADLLALNRYRSTLEYLSLENIVLAEGSWEEVFHAMSSYTSLTYIEFYKCCYDRYSPYWAEGPVAYAKNA